MPQMNGIQFLAQVRKMAPDTVRVMSTGARDFAIVVDAVNDDHIYRFIPKPVSIAVLTQVMNCCIDQYFLRYAEKQLLEMTLHRSIKMLTEILSIARPAAYGRASRLRRLVSEIGRQLGMQDLWQVEIVAMLSQTGSMALPEEILEKARLGSALTAQEKKALARIPQVGHDLVANIPRLEPVALAILYQEKGFDGSGPPDDEISGEEIPLPSRILKAAVDLDSLVARGASNQVALSELSKRLMLYDPNVLSALARVIGAEIADSKRALRIAELGPNMILDADVLNANGHPLLKKGQELTPAMLSRLRELALFTEIGEPIQVRVSAAS
jgi:response regulator RpfG family c-di-GMP phosphodiesterase